MGLAKPGLFRPQWGDSLTQTQRDSLIWGFWFGSWERERQHNSGSLCNTPTRTVFAQLWDLVAWLRPFQVTRVTSILQREIQPESSPRPQQDSRSGSQRVCRSQKRTVACPEMKNKVRGGFCFCQPMKQQYKTPSPDQSSACHLVEKVPEREVEAGMICEC